MEKTEPRSFDEDLHSEECGERSGAAVPRAAPLSLAVPAPLLTQHEGQRGDGGHRQLHTLHDVGDSPQGAVLVQQLLWLEQVNH